MGGSGKRCRLCVSGRVFVALEGSFSGCADGVWVGKGWGGCICGWGLQVLHVLYVGEPVLWLDRGQIHWVR